MFYKHNRDRERPDGLSPPTPPGVPLRGTTAVRRLCRFHMQLRQAQTGKEFCRKCKRRCRAAAQPPRPVIGPAGIPRKVYAHTPSSQFPAALKSSLSSISFIVVSGSIIDFQCHQVRCNFMRSLSPHWIPDKRFRE